MTRRRDCNLWARWIDRAAHRLEGSDTGPIHCGFRKRFSRWMAANLAAAEQLVSAEWLAFRCRSPEPALQLLQGRLALVHGKTSRRLWHGIASSRLGRKLDRRPQWFQAFRETCLGIKQRGELLFTVDQTTAGRFAKCAAELFAIPTLTIHVPRPRETFESWLRRMAKGMKSRERVGAGDPTYERSEIYLSPKIDSAPADRNQREAPLRDALAIALADWLSVLHLRRGGNIERLVRARFAANPACEPNVLLAVGPGLVDATLANEWVSRGAVKWEVCQSKNTDENTPTLLNEFAADEPSKQACKILELVDDDSNYLHHCTRAAGGAWPDQTEDEYLRELLTGATIPERSPFASLYRIVQQGRLLASGRGIRGKVPVICWSEMPLSELARRRIFRAHRGRWDFEPFGISVRRDWLLERGARRVIYGDDALWQKSSADDRPFFQLATSRTKQTGHVMDWTTEQEWRLPGDLPLDQVPPDAARLFVPSIEDAQRLAAISHWPIVVVAQRNAVASVGGASGKKK